jgi:autonomous glycyl radical cofactor GrcA
MRLLRKKQPTYHSSVSIEAAPSAKIIGHPKHTNVQIVEREKWGKVYKHFENFASLNLHLEEIKSSSTIIQRILKSLLKIT